MFMFDYLHLLRLLSCLLAATLIHKLDNKAWLSRVPLKTHSLEKMGGWLRLFCIFLIFFVNFTRAATPAPLRRLWEQLMSTMNQRLKHARLQAGFKTATAAIEHCGWNSSTYRAHENGQNNYKIKDAKIYADAYDVSPVWLLVGENDAEQKKIKARHKHNCSETIYAAALLLRDDPQNLQLLKKIQACIASQLAKSS